MSIPNGIINCDSCGSMNDPTWKVCCKCSADPLVDAEGAAYDRMLTQVENRKASSISRPDIGTTWRHNNGALYVVRLYTNEHSERPEYPVTIVYEGAGRRTWSRPLSDWHRSFSPV